MFVLTTIGKAVIQCLTKRTPPLHLAIGEYAKYFDDKIRTEEEEMILDDVSDSNNNNNNNLSDEEKLDIDRTDGIFKSNTTKKKTKNRTNPPEIIDDGIVGYNSNQFLDENDTVNEKDGSVVMDEDDRIEKERLNEIRRDELDRERNRAFMEIVQQLATTNRVKERDAFQRNALHIAVRWSGVIVGTLCVFFCSSLSILEEKNSNPKICIYIYIYNLVLIVIIYF